MTATHPKRSPWATRADKLVREYAVRIGDPDADTSTLVGDLLADLMHLCRRQKVAFERCLQLARDHCREEEARVETIRRLAAERGFRLVGYDPPDRVLLDRKGWMAPRWYRFRDEDSTFVSNGGRS